MDSSKTYEERVAELKELEEQHAKLAKELAQIEKSRRPRRDSNKVTYMEYLFLNLHSDAISLLNSDATQLVGLSGAAGAGKSTVAKHLRERWDFHEVQLARPLKEAACKLLNVPMEFMEDRELKEGALPGWGNLTARRVLQVLGDALRNLRDDFLLNRAELEIQAKVWDEDVSRVVISDVRYDNEAEYLRSKRNAVIWRVDHGSRDIAPNMSEESKGHASEKGLSPHLVTESLDNSKSSFDPREVDRLMLGLLL